MGFNPVDIRIGYFPTKIFTCASLLYVLFQEDRSSGIGGEYSRRGKQHLPYAITHGYPATQELRVLSHRDESLALYWNRNSTDGLLPVCLWKMNRWRFWLHHQIRQKIQHER